MVQEPVHPDVAFVKVLRSGKRELRVILIGHEKVRWWDGVDIGRCGGRDRSVDGRAEVAFDDVWSFQRQEDCTQENKGKQRSQR